MKNARKLTAYRSLYLSKFPKVDLTTTRSLTDEYFAYLRYYSEIEEVGLELVKAHGCQDAIQIKRIFFLLQSFVRQGKTFFEAAEKLDYRASPLLYYYSFLNLAKAYLCLKNPDEVDKKIKHGLTHDHTTAEFQSQSVLVANRGVFPIFYRTLMGISISSPLSLNITSLLGYIPDIQHEYMTVNYGCFKFAEGLARLFVNEHTKKAWPFLAISKHKEIKDSNAFFKSFYEYFEEVDISATILKEAFNINAEEKRFLIYFQSKAEYDFSPDPIQKVTDDCLSFMGNYCKPVSFNSYNDFHLFLPDENQIPFNDILATYVIMFYLGSLVRYHPSYLENLLNSKHAWIVEGFTKQVGCVFLRNITNLITQKNYVFRTI